MDIDDENPAAPPSQASPLEALLGSRANFGPMLDIPHDDDEAMVELAIALSLQEQVLKPEC